jgi:hypothetical protein
MQIWIQREAAGREADVIEYHLTEPGGFTLGLFIITTLFFLNRAPVLIDSNSYNRPTIAGFGILAIIWHLTINILKHFDKVMPKLDESTHATSTIPG